MKKVVLLILLISAFSINNIFSQEELPCENAINYGSVNDPSMSGSILSGGESWYYIDIPNDMQNVLFSTYGTTEFDTEMEIWRSCEDDEYWKYNDDALNYFTSYVSEIFVENLSAGRYYIKIYGRGDDYGNFILKIIDDLPEGICATALDFGNINGPAVIQESLSDGYFWYKITTTEDYNNVLFSTCDATEIDGGLIITTNCEGEDESLIEWAEEGINCSSPEALINYLPAGTYYILIYKLEDAEDGPFSLKITSDNDILPVVTEYYPREDQQNVATNTFIELKFNIPIEVNDLSGVKIIYGNDLEVTGVTANIATWSDKVIEIENDVLFGNTVYTVIIPNTAIVNVNEEIRWSFKTSTGPNSLDILDISPWYDSQNIDVLTSIYVAFSLPITLGENIENIEIIDNEGENIYIYESAIYYDKQLWITYGILDYGKTYTVIIPVGAIQDYYQEIRWSFTTLDKPEIIIASRTPGVDADKIALNAEVSVRFNENITEINSGLDNVKITYGEDSELTGVSATVEGNVLKIAHAAFNYETEYTVNIPTGTIQDYDQAIIWKFKTIRDVFVPVSKSNEIYIYPNPSTGLINVEVSENSVIKIIDVTGKVIETKSVNSGSISNFTLTTGIYFVQIETEKDNSVHKVIINK